MNSAVALLFVLVTLASAQNHQLSSGQRKCSFSEFVLVLDESSSIKPNNWNDVKDFAKKLVSAAGISQYGNRGAVASFSDDGRIRINCDDHLTTDSFLGYIDKLDQKGEWTNMEDGLEKGKHLLQNSGCGERENSFSKILFFFTDGVPNRGGNMKSLLAKAKSIRDMGIKIVSIGVGDYIDFSVLERITGDRSNVFQVDNFQELTKDTLIDQLINPICVDPDNSGPIVIPERTTTTTPKPTTTTTTTTTTPKPTTTTTTTTTPKPTTTTTTTTTTPKPTTTTTTTTPKPTTTTTTTPKPTTTTTTTTSKPTTTTQRPTTTTTTTTPTTTTTTTTTTPKPTTTTTTTTTKPTTTAISGVPSLCSCSLDDKQVPLLKLSVFDIDNKFPGDCREERAKAAVAALVKQIDEIKQYRENFKSCRKEIRRRAYRERNQYIREELYFYKVDECSVNIECKLPAWTNVLEKKKCELEDELRWYGGTYGKIWDYGEETYNKVAGIWK